MEQNKYPVSWDLSELFPSKEAWYQGESDARKLMESFGDFKGTLTTAEGILAFCKTVLDGPFTTLCNKLALYAELQSALNSSDPTTVDMQAKLNRLWSEYEEKTAFVDGEISSLPLDQRKEIFSSDLLKDYAYAMRQYTDEKAVFFSAETNSALAKLGLLRGQSDNAFSVMCYVDNPDPEIKNDQGEIVKVTDAVFNEVIHGDDSHDYKIRVADAYYSKPQQFRNVYASLLNTKLIEHMANAKLQNYDSVLDYQLSRSDVEPEVYRTMLSATRKILPIYHRYLDLHKKVMGLDEQYYFDTMNASSEFRGTLTYDEAVDDVRNSLSILGKEYSDVLKEMTETPHIDVYPGETKNTGGFMTSCMNGKIAPYILMNFAGQTDDACTLAHELGHAVYGYLAEHNPALNQCSNAPGIFTHEVASTCNEYLYGFYQMDHTDNVDEKQFYLENLLIMMNGTIVRQMMYSEFEEYLYSIVEQGGSLDASTISEKWMELNRIYYGENIRFNDCYQYRWAMIPHFYYGYYVYKYATSATYSAAIAKRILDGEEGALEQYLDFLKAGGSEKPSGLLKKAGVDPLEESTYDAMIAFYESLVDRYEELIKK